MRRVLLSFRERREGEDDVSVIADLWRNRVSKVAVRLGTPLSPVERRREGDRIVRVMRFPKGEYRLVFTREGDALYVEGELISYQ